jgi:LacI family transcriptional regulator
VVVVPVGKRGRATLRDVAERAGVSATTASFVLSGRRDMRISAATEERVLQAARTLEYRRRLVPRTTMPAGAAAIGLVSDVVATESFAGDMLLGSIAATDLGHVVLMTDSEGVDDLEISAVHALLARGVEKFVYATMATSTRSVPQALRDRRLVLVNTVDPSLAAPAVVPDDFEAGRTRAGVRWPGSSRTGGGSADPPP